MRKPIFRVCKQKGHKPACASAQRRCFSLIGKYEISILLLVSIAEETCLGLTYSEPPKTGFVASWPILGNILSSCQSNVQLSG